MSDKTLTVLSNMLSVARRRKKKKSKNARMRSQMLKMIMPYLSRESGDKLASAIDKDDADIFRSTWDTIRESISDRMKSSSSSVDTDEILDDLKELIMADMQVTSNNDDYSLLLAGDNSHTEYLRQFVANGKCNIEGKVLRVLKMDVLDSVLDRTKNENVRVSVSASYDGRIIAAEGTYAEASTEIVMQAIAT